MERPFSVASGNPFNNSLGFRLPLPEGTTKFPANDPNVTHLLIAHAHMPPTELNEAAGFTGTAGTIDPAFDQFDDGRGGKVPMPDASGFRNEPIRAAMVARLNATPAYRSLFGALFPTVASGGPITMLMFARAIAEFEFTLVFANAPVDHFARGETTAMTDAQKQGATHFLRQRKMRWVPLGRRPIQRNVQRLQEPCHRRAPTCATFRGGKGDTMFDGIDNDEDFGLEQDTV